MNAYIKVVSPSLLLAYYSEGIYFDTLQLFNMRVLQLMDDVFEMNGMDLLASLLVVSYNTQGWRHCCYWLVPVYA